MKIAGLIQIKVKSGIIASARAHFKFCDVPTIRISKQHPQIFLRKNKIQNSSK